MADGDVLTIVAGHQEFAAGGGGGPVAAAEVVVDPAIHGSNVNAQTALEWLEIKVGEAGDGSLLLTPDQKAGLVDVAVDGSNPFATVADTGLPAVLLRDPSTGGETITHTPAVDLPANVDAIATATGTGAADARRTANSVDGTAQAGSVATTTGSGIADVTAQAHAEGTGDANAGPEASSVDGAAVAKPTATSTGTGDTDVRPTAVGVDGIARAGSEATTTGSGDAITSPVADTVDGDASAAPTASASGTGAATVKSSASTLTGTAQAGSFAIRSGVKAGMEAIVDGTSARMGFNGTTPIARPEVPANPTPQDIADTLVALGLITQAV